MPSACVIGAGVSGIAAAKALRERGIRVQGYEKGSLPGGLWRYGNDNGLSGIYESLHLNTSRTQTEFPDFPMPPEYPDYPDHRQFLRYLEAVLDRFELGSVFRYRTEVTRIVSEGTRWNVRLADGTAATYDAVCISTGHHWKPRHPSFPGRFSGSVLHSHDYRTPDLFRGKRVLVVGIGNSGVDIACDAARVGAATFLSTRRGAHVLPKVLWGRPIDLWGKGAVSYLPPRIQGWAISALAWMARGSLSSYGLPRPAFRVEEAHPTLSSELLGFLREGRIRVMPDVKELAGEAVSFRDGTSEPIDIVITATGYEVAHPFLDGAASDGQDLYYQVVPPARPGLYFIGLVQPLQGSVLRAAEAQSRWVAGLIAGDTALPPPDEMLRSIEEARRWRESSLVRTPRHGLEINHYAYLRALRREMKRRSEKNP